MALPPTIPTSFAPHSASASAQRFRSDFVGAFALFAYFLLGIAFVLALGVFLYGRMLASELSVKDVALAKAEESIDPVTVEGFVRLQNRLNFSSSLLNKHVAFSNFFTSLTTLLPTPVRFSALRLSLDAADNASVEGTGIAKNFNALAAVSAAFASDGRIRDAIFSKIGINKDGSVAFNLSAALDPKLVAFSPQTTPILNTSEPNEPSADLSAPPAETGALLP